MSLEALMKSTLGSLVSSRVHADVTPDVPVFPLFIYQQVGGDPTEFIDGSLPDKDSARIQVWTWCDTAIERRSLSRQARVAMTGTLKATTLTQPVHEYNSVLKKFGCRQDFGVWFTP